MVGDTWISRRVCNGASDCFYRKVEAKDNSDKTGESSCASFTTSGCNPSYPCCDSNGDLIPSGNDGSCPVCQTCSGSSSSCVDNANDNGINCGTGKVCWGGQCDFKCDPSYTGGACNGDGEVVSSYCESDTRYSSDTEKYFKDSIGDNHCDERFGSSRGTCWCRCDTGYVVLSNSRCAQKCGTGTGEVCAGYADASCAGATVSGYELFELNNDYCNSVSSGYAKQCWCKPSCVAEGGVCSVSEDCCGYDGNVEGAYCNQYDECQKGSDDCLQTGYSQLWKCNPDYASCVNPSRTYACCEPTGAYEGLSGGLEEQIIVF